MIFVTVGTSLPHDSLIREMDNLVEDSTLNEEVVAQIGAGEYVPKHFESFRFRPTLEDFFERADVIVSNCGAGTIMENVTKGRRLVVIQNPDITGGHEWELVKKMEQGQHLVWCRSLEGLPQCIARARSANLVRFSARPLDLSAVLADLLR